MITVILCGGAGSRLWPVSRASHPKPFIPMFNGQTLLEQTYLRAAHVQQPQELVTVTSDALYFQAELLYARLKLDLKNTYILEPVSRNTAPAITLATHYVCEKYGPDEPLLVLSADHLIQREDMLNAAVSKALAMLADYSVVVFGMQPTSPDTGFGYIQVEGERVVRFTEKPSAEKARAYLQQGACYWNAGMFCFKSGVMMEALKQYAPEIYALSPACFPSGSMSATNRSAAIPIEKNVFTKMPDISIDYAVMEHAEHIGVVPCNMGWQDIGSWEAICGDLPEDEHKNHIKLGTDVMARDSENCCIWGEDGRLIATLGISNILIVDTKDALVVADRKKANDVRHIYNSLKKQNRPEFLEHNTVYRPWGSVTVLETGDRFKIKRLVVAPGRSISLQLHHHRSEHWIVVSGMAQVVCGDSTLYVNTNESAYIKAGHKHRVMNNGVIDLIIIEVQIGDYLGEDDIVRFSDAYGRV